MMARTDRHRNPTAFTTMLARQAKLTYGVDYKDGDPFMIGGREYRTARLLGDPVDITCRVIDAVGFYTLSERQRWAYIAMPAFVWQTLESDMRRRVIGFMYHHEGGTELEELFKKGDP